MPKVILSIKAVITNESRLLTLKQSRQRGYYWDLPGGKLEYGESPEGTLKREVQEETGLSIKIINLIGVWWFFSPNHQNQVVCLTYFCKADKAKIDLSKNPAQENIEDYKWISKQEFLNGEYNNNNESYINLIKDFEL